VTLILTFDQVIRHTVVYNSSTPTSIRIYKISFKSRQTDICTGGQTDIETSHQLYYLKSEELT